MPRGGELHHRTLERYVLPDEQIVVATRRHWGKILEPVTTAILAFLLVGFIAGLAGDAVGDLITVLWFGWLTLAARAVWEILQWRNEWFVATDKRLLLIYGLITHKVAMMPLGKVTDMNYNRTLLGQIFGYGTFILESAGQDQALHTITWVPRPDQTYRDICDTLFGPDRSDSDDGSATPEPSTEPEADDSVADPGPFEDLPNPPTPTAPMRPVPPPLPPAIPPTTPRPVRASGPTMPVQDEATESLGEAWIVSDETRAPFVPVSAPSPGQQEPPTRQHFQ